MGKIYEQITTDDYKWQISTLEDAQHQQSQANAN